jgi:hypothetical protein
MVMSSRPAWAVAQTETLPQKSILKCKNGKVINKTKHKSINQLTCTFKQLRVLHIQNVTATWQTV